MPLLPRSRLGDVALVDTQDDPVALQRCDLEEHLAALDRRAERLAEVALHHDAVEGRDQPRALELRVEQIELRLRLIDLGAEEVDLAAVVLGQGLALLGLNRPLEARPVYEELVSAGGNEYAVALKAEIQKWLSRQNSDDNDLTLRALEPWLSAQ